MIGPVDGDSAAARDTVRAEPKRTIKTIDAQNVAWAIEVGCAINNDHKDGIRRYVERERSWSCQKITDIAKISGTGLSWFESQEGGAADGVVGNAEAR